MAGYTFFPFLPPEGGCHVKSLLRWLRPASASVSTVPLPLRRRLELPFRPTPRIAVVDAPHILGGRRIRHFSREQADRITRFRPGVLAAPVEALLSLAEQPGLVLTHAVISLTRIGGPRLDEAGRRRLWTKLQVPIFEQLEWHDGALVAEECEAHSSLHVRQGAIRMETSESGEAIFWLETDGTPGERVASGFTVATGPQVCNCGEVAARLAHRPSSLTAVASA